MFNFNSNLAKGKFNIPLYFWKLIVKDNLQMA